MSIKAQAQIKAGSQQILSPAPTGLLQRKCACGKHTMIGGECTACSRKKQWGLQTKLKVNEPGDIYEQEADRVAQAMMGSFSHPIEPKSEAGTELHHPAESDLMKGGVRLPPDVAEFYETRFGRDFSAVRVHSGETATRYNEAVNAYAFTYGSHVWFGPGLRPQPSHILAHELAHVVQQMQPPPLASASDQPDLSSSRRGVQRFAPYWMPERYTAVGTESHAFILPKIGKKNGIFTEAPVPNAGKTGAAPGGEKAGGIADLYQASTTVGVFLVGEKLPKKLKSNRQLKYKGEHYRHTVLSAPQADEERRSVIRAGSAPTEIFVGDLKPSHGTIEALEGAEQVKGYLIGFENTHKNVNEMDVGQGGFEQTDAKWPPLKTGIIKLEIPEEFEEPLAKGQRAQPLKLIHNSREVVLRREVMGKVYVRPDPGGGGIWNYIWAPTTRLTTADLPASVTGLEADITAKIIRPLLVSPVATAAKAKPAICSSSITPSPLRIQARGREKAPVEVKDPFDKAAFDTWKTDHNRITGEEKQLEKTPEFKEAEFKSLIVENRQAAIKSGFNFPDVLPKDEKTAKTPKKIRFWTGASSAFLGRLRYWFGGAFVKVYNAYHSIRNRFKKILDGKSATKPSGLLGTIFKIAFNILKIVGRILVERTANELVRSLTTGVERKLKALIPEDRIEEFEAKIEEVRKLADYLEQQVKETVEALVGRTIGPYEKYIGAIVEVANDVSKTAEVVNKVRWGARVIACLSPPGWGCLWILAESVIEKFASWVIDRCWFKQEIAPLVTRFKFIADLPKDLAQIIIDKVRGFLPGQLHDVFADVNSSEIKTNILSHEICNENDRDTLPRDRFLLEKLALAELRKEIGEKKWLAWTKLGEIYGVNRALPLTEEEIVQLKKELQKADLNALKEAADLYGAFTPSKEVTNLTTFLEEVEQKKEEIYGGGDPGGQGGDESVISVSASEKALDREYKPTKLGFEVVRGVTKGQYQGDIIKVDRAALIKGTMVTLEGVEVVVGKRVFIPNQANPEKVLVPLEVTRNQYFDIEKKYGVEVVKKIGYKSFEYKKGVKFSYTLQLNAGKAE